MSSSRTFSKNSRATKKAYVNEATSMWQVHQQQAHPCLQQAMIATNQQYRSLKETTIIRRQRRL